jgi:hypothetical protein
VRREEEPFNLSPFAAGDRSWRELAVSTALHALVIFLVLWGTRRPERVDEGTQESRIPIAVAPDEREQYAAREPEPQRQQPEEPQDRPRAIGPDSDRPDELIPRERGEQTPPPDPEEVPSEAPRSDPEPAQAAANRVETAGEAAQRGGVRTPPTSPFGRQTAPNPLPSGQTAGSGAARSTVMGRSGISGTDSRSWRPSFEEAAGSCPEIPDLGTNPDGTPVLASVVGYVFDERGNPLPNAHLQIVGAPFTSFSDRNGAYRLEFDPRMLGKCRVQYVRVQADGFRGQTLVLAVGRSVRSDDVILKR